MESHITVLCKQKKRLEAAFDEGLDEIVSGSFSRHSNICVRLFVGRKSSLVGQERHDPACLNNQSSLSRP